MDEVVRGAPALRASTSTTRDRSVERSTLLHLYQNNDTDDNARISEATRFLPDEISKLLPGLIWALLFLTVNQRSESFPEAETFRQSAVYINKDKVKVGSLALIIINSVLNLLIFFSLTRC